MNKGPGYGTIIIVFIILSVVFAVFKSIGTSNSYKNETRRKAELYIAQMEDQAREARTTSSPTPKSASTYTYNGGGSKKSNGSDPYNASDYDDYENFYDDHWDDFFDIDDAEDYWIKNH